MSPIEMSIHACRPAWLRTTEQRPVTFHETAIPNILGLGYPHRLFLTVGGNPASTRNPLDAGRNVGKKQEERRRPTSHNSVVTATSLDDR